MSSSLYKKIITGVSAAGAVVGTMALANKFLSDQARRKEVPVSEENYYNWRYGRVFYTRTGSGSPLVLVHGLYPGASGAAFDEIAASLSERHTVYCLDLLGFGRSDKPQLTYTAFFYVQLLGDFIENIVRKPAAVLADGMSCTFSTIACQIQPSMYTQLILINPPSEAETQKIPTRFQWILRKILEFPLIGTFAYNMTITRTALRYRFGSVLPEKTLIQLCALAHRHDYSARYAFASLVTYYMNANLSRPLSKTDKDIYIVLSGDATAANDKIETFSRINPSAETEFVGGSNAFIWLQDPEKILSICHMLLS